MAAAFCELDQFFHHRQVTLSEDFPGPAPRPDAGPLRHRLAQAKLPGEQPVSQRRIGYEGYALPGAFGENISLRVARQHVVPVLDAHETGGASFCGGLRLTKLLEGEVRTADLPYLARPHQLGQSAERFRNRHLPVGSVELIKVDAIRSEALQTRFDRQPDILWARAAALALHRDAELGGKHNLLAPAS